MRRTEARRKSNRLRNKSTHNEVHNNWEISYGDMITLLLGFFILFFNIKADRVNLKLLVQKLEKNFNKAKGDALRTGFEQKNESTKNLLTTQSLQKYKLHTNISGEKLYIEFPGVSFFDAGQITLTREGREALDQFAKSLDKAIGSVRFVVRGYTDNVPSPTGGPYDNLELSARRSLSAIRHLHQRGMELRYLRIGGYGESDLSDRRLPAAERRLDRKIVIIVEPLDSAERHHESLNEVADAEQRERDLKEARARRDLRHPILDMIEEPSLAVWIQNQLAAYETADKGMGSTSAKALTVRTPASQQATPSALSTPQGLPSEPRALKTQRPSSRLLDGPPVHLGPSVPLREQKQIPIIKPTGRESGLGSWIQKTYLYKKMNPYYFHQSSKTDPRGEP